MSDTDQGNDSALFQEALGTTIDKFENPTLPPEPKPTDQPTNKPADLKPGEVRPQEQDAPVPAGRLREEADARRRAERERDDMRIRLEAAEAVRRHMPQQQAPQQEPADIYANPQGFVRQQVDPIVAQLIQHQRATSEILSENFASRHYGREKVIEARQALKQGIDAGDPEATNVYNAAMQHPDPYEVIMTWHQNRQTLSSIGGDLNAYRQKLLDEALKDPEYLKRAIEAAKGQAATNGQQINRPGVVQPRVPVIPSLSDIGAAGPDEQQHEPSDEALFRAAVSAKRR